MSDSPTLSLDKAREEYFPDAGRNQIYAAAHRGDLPVIRMGRRLYVVRSALEKMLAAPSGSGGVHKMRSRKAKAGAK